MKIKWADLYKDIKSVFKKHFKPEKPEPDGPAVSLIRMLQSIQNQQQGVNRIRTDTAELVKMLQDDDVIKEFHRLEAMTEDAKESAAPVARSDKPDDCMFI